jgi:hypothetical protein
MIVRRGELPLDLPSLVHAFEYFWPLPVIKGVELVKTIEMEP